MSVTDEIPYILLFICVMVGVELQYKHCRAVLIVAAKIIQTTLIVLLIRLAYKGEIKNISF